MDRATGLGGISRTESDETGDSLSDLVQVGTEIVGGAGGAALGFIMGGASGAVAGGAGAPLLIHTLRAGASELRRRYLGPREEIRVGAAIAFAIQQIDRNLKSGMIPRGDGFFDSSVSDRGAAVEVLEGVLKAAQQEHEEKKVKHLGFLYANIAFDDSIDRGMANHIIKLANALTFRQFCLLEFADRPIKSMQLRDFDFRTGPYGDSQEAVIQEIMEMKRMELIGFLDLADPGSIDIIPSRMEAFGLGSGLADLMQTCQIDAEDMDLVAAVLSGSEDALD